MSQSIPCKKGRISAIPDNSSNPQLLYGFILASSWRHTEKCLKISRCICLQGSLSEWGACIIIISERASNQKRLPLPLIRKSHSGSGGYRETVIGAPMALLQRWFDGTPHNINVRPTRNYCIARSQVHGAFTCFLSSMLPSPGRVFVSFRLSSLSSQQQLGWNDRDLGVILSDH